MKAILLRVKICWIFFILQYPFKVEYILDMRVYALDLIVRLGGGNCMKQGPDARHAVA